MPRGRDSVFDEPALSGRPTAPNADSLRDEAVRRPVRDDRAGTADEVWEEPTANHALRPAGSAPTYRERNAAAWGAVTAADRLRGFALLAFVSCALGIACSVIQESISGAGLPGAVLIAPVIEELGKTLGVATLLERRPWLLGGRLAVFALCALSGLFFATIENLAYLHVYLPDASAEDSLWRWTICTALHVVCCLISAVGLSREWSDAARGRALGRFAVAAPWLVAAMVLHGLYNAFATGWAILAG